MTSVIYGVEFDPFRVEGIVRLRDPVALPPAIEFVPCGDRQLIRDMGSRRGREIE